MDKKKFPVLGEITLFLALFAISLFLESHYLNLLFGVSLSFTNIALILFIRRYGFKYGLPTALLVYLVSIFVWDAPYSVIIFLLELVVVSVSLQFTKKGRIILFDWIFWLLIGTPLLLVLYNLTYTAVTLDLWLLITVYIVNGLFNMMLAEMICDYAPKRLLSHKILKTRLPLYFYKILYHIIFIAITLPFLFHLVNSSYSASDSILKYTSKLTSNMSQNILEDMEHALDDRSLTSQETSTLLSSQLQAIVNGYANEQGYHMIILNKNNQIIASSHGSLNSSFPLIKLQNDTLYLHNESTGQHRIVPNQEWNETKYIYQTAIGDDSHKLYMQFTMPFLKEHLFRQYFGIFLCLLIFFIGAAFVGHFLNRRILRALNELTDLSTDLPEKLYKGVTVNWPDSRIIEIRSLIRNFRAMSNTLVQKIQESLHSNQLLQLQTTELQKSEKRLHHLAYYDGLTGLPNRQHFIEYTKTLDLENPDKKHPFAIMFADLNRFKQVNDILGHTIGDQLLHKVSNRFTDIVSEQCKVFRISGDEFLFILHYEDISDVQRIAGMICDSLETPFDINGRSIYMSVSVGISVYPYDGNELEHIMRNADIAMYVAKEQGDGFYHFYDSLVENQRTLRMQLENELKSALRNGQFTLYYQPKVDAVSNNITGAEALIRWNHPEYGVISPSEFIPLAENSGIILDIDEWVLREACRQNKAWQDQGIHHFPISINISARHFYQNNLISMITRILEETGLHPSYVVLELTEGTLIKDVKYGIQVMEDLTKLGIQISMDDFGTGYSSLSQLDLLPISEMKLDRSFIQGLTNDSRKSSIVRAVIELGHHMDLKVVAEGIESSDDLMFLTELKCDQFQGYFFSKPLPSEEFSGFVTNWDSST